MSDSSNLRDLSAAPIGENEFPDPSADHPRSAVVRVATSPSLRHRRRPEAPPAIEAPPLDHSVDVRLNVSVNAGVKRSSTVQVFGNDCIGAALLSAVAGYVDTAGFLALFGLFPAHLTGDLVTAGAAMAARVRFGVAAKLAMIPLFMLAVAGAAIVARAFRRRGTAPLAPLLALMTAALSIFCVTGVAFSPLVSGPDAWAVMVIGGTGVVAMGIQNALMREVLGTFTQTTVMTGNLTQFTMDLVELALPAPGNDAERERVRSEATRRLIKFGTPLAGFMIGAALGAWLTGIIGLRGLALPTLVVAALTGTVRRQARA